MLEADRPGSKTSVAMGKLGKSSLAQDLESLTLAIRRDPGTSGSLGAKMMVFKDDIEHYIKSYLDYWALLASKEAIFVVEDYDHRPDPTGTFASLINDSQGLFRTTLPLCTGLDPWQREQL